MVQLYAGLRDAELRDAAARYVDEFVRKNIFEELFELVARMRKAGVELWAVSSTNRWVIAEGMRDFGIPDERILAAEVRVKDGLITSEIVDVPTDEAKAAALRRAGLPHPDAVFGNSIHDLAMLEMARCRFPGQSLSVARRGRGKERLGLLPAQGRRGHRCGSPWRIGQPGLRFFAARTRLLPVESKLRMAFVLRGLH